MKRIETSAGHVEKKARLSSRGQEVKFPYEQYAKSLYFLQTR
jgi:hypothetical protein